MVSPSAPPTPVGLIGIGLIGSALAERLLAMGHRVIGHDIAAARREALTRLGGETASDAAAVFRSCPRVILSLPTHVEVEVVLKGAGEELRRGHVVVDTTTGDPDATEELATRLAARGVSYLDATISGSSSQLREGAAVLMVGGGTAAFAACRDIFAPLGHETFHCGGPGSGARMKLVTNVVLGLNRAALAEGLALAQGLGLDARQALTVMQHGPAYSRIMDRKGERMLTGNFEPEARLSQHLKDVRLIVDQGDAAGLPMPLSRAHRAVLEEAEGAVASSYSQTTNTRDRVQMSRPNANNLISTRARQLNDTDTRVRSGISGKLEYRLDPQTKVGVSAAFNYFTFGSDRTDWDITSTNRVADYTRVSRAQIEAGTAPRDSTNQTAGIAPGFTDTYNELLNATVRNRYTYGSKLSQQSKFGVEGRKQLGDTRLDLRASYNPSSYRSGFGGFEARRNGGIGVGYDTTKEATRPVLTQTYGPSIGLGADFNNFFGLRFAQPDYTFEDITDARGDLQHAISSLPFPVLFKTGFDYRRQHRWLTTYRPTWNYVGPDRVQQRNPATGVNDDNIAQFLSPWRYSIFNNAMMQRDHLDYRLADALIISHPEYWLPSGTSVTTFPVPRIVTEDVAAGYTQATVKLGRLTILGGARFEQTAVVGKGSLSDPALPTQTSVSVARSYQAWYPSVHLRYTVTPNFLLRSSFSTSGARPSLSALVPDTTVSYATDGTGLGRVTQSNPGLKPQYARTYDFSAEYYLEPAGLVSAGVFRKDISNYISRSTRTIGEGSSNGFGGRYEDFELSTTGNLGTALVEGVELSYTQQLRGLPRPFNGLSVFANYTGLRTQGTYSDGVAELANFVPRTYNAGLIFNWRQIEARATYHYKSGYLMTYNADPASQTRVSDDPTVDLNLQYRIRPGLTVFADYINIFNNSPDWWAATPRHITMSELYGARLNVGLSGRF